MWSALRRTHSDLVHKSYMSHDSLYPRSVRVRRLRTWTHRGGLRSHGDKTYTHFGEAWTCDP